MDDQPIVIDRRSTITRRRKTSWAARVRLGLSFVTVLCLLVVAGWYLMPSPKRPAGGGRFAGAGSTPVGIAKVTRGDMPVIRQALGTVTPVATVTVVTQISGTITQIGFTEGQPVKRGDFLIQIDPRPYEVALRQARGTLRHDQALLDNARVDLARYRKLLAQDSIAEQSVATQEALVRQDEGAVETDKGAVASAELNLTYCHIVSPIEGRAGLRQVDLGNYVTPGTTSGLVTLTQTKPITVVFTLPEDDVQVLSQRVHAGAALKVIAYDRNRTNKLAEGTLAAIDSQIDVSTGTVKLKANFANDDEKLFPQQFVNVDLELDTVKDTNLVPQSAIQRGVPGTYVYLLDTESSKVRVQPVKLGPGNADVVSVGDGLDPGDSVVVDGTDRLKDGDHVIVAGKPHPAGGKPAGAGAASGDGTQRHHHRDGAGQTGPGQAAPGDAAPAAPSGPPAAPAQ